MVQIVKMYKSLTGNNRLLPSSTGFTWWDTPFTAYSAQIDREFARRFSKFEYFDFLDEDDELDPDDPTDLASLITHFQTDVLSVLTFNQKKYSEMYRIFLATDTQMPFDYNYDMTETHGKEHQETMYGATSATKGAQENTVGQVTDTHNIAPFNTSTLQAESNDVTSQQTLNDGARTDTTLSHTDEFDSDEWTLKRKGNIGVQTAGDIARVFTDYWSNHYKFMQMIFDDICRELLQIGG